MQWFFVCAAVLLAVISSGSVAFAQLDIPSEMTLVGPCRLLDTSRSGQAPGLLNNETRAVDVRGQCGIPVEATGIIGNLRVFAAPGPGTLQIYRADAPLAPFPALSYALNAHVAYMVVSALSTLEPDPTDPEVLVDLDEDIHLTAKFGGAAAGSRIRVVLDVMGYFRASSSP